MKLLRVLVAVTMTFGVGNAFPASGEMGTGVPHFGMYSAATGMQLVVFSIANATRPFPAGCTNLILTPGTMGMDSYKMAMATMTAAKVAGASAVLRAQRAGRRMRRGFRLNGRLSRRSGRAGVS